MNYVELHARSAFSFLEGASTPEELIDACVKFEMPAMALVDRNGVYGSPRFHMAAKKNGIRAHIGAEVTAILEPGLKPGPKIAPACVSLPLAVKNRTGYRNLCSLITLIKMRAPKIARPGEVAATLDELIEHSEGLICFTGGEDGPLASALAPSRSTGRSNQYEKACQYARLLVGIYGQRNVYAELQRHFNREEEARNHAIIQIAGRLKLPLLATGGVSHATPEERELLDVLTCIRNHVKLETAGRLLSRNSERYLKPYAVIKELFEDLPEAVANTAEVSARLGFTMRDLGYEFPLYPVPDGETMDSFLRKRTYEGARRRYNGRNGTPTLARALKQIDHELAVIEKLGLAGYFLIVWDLINFCADNGILVQGRGSAANSAVCYSLGITAVDAVGMELLFERFLSEERGEWPDIDLDLPSGDQRERVIQYVYERYGIHGAAMTANVITYRGRSAAREVGKVMGFDEESISRLSSLVHGFEWHDPKDTAEHQFDQAGFELSNPRIQKFLELFLAIQNMPRHLGQHSGGMVICQGRLSSVVPLEPATMPGRVVVQWDKEDCADMGIIKVDLLGLGMMAALEESIVLIRDHYHEELDLAHLPPNDPEVYAALQKADTVGMFQIESRAQMSCLPRLRPMRFYDIVVQVAIIRPGPIVGNMVHPYLNRRLGREEPVCLHPSLEPVLKRTLGVPLFQEQLLRIAMICAGFTGGEAEELRRAMGFKRSEVRMREIEVKLRRGMDRNGITGETQDRIVQAITSFALYGFPESHAASFALIAYASAYIKCHYLAAFTAALMNNQPMGFYQPATLIKDAERHGLKVKPIDVTRSDWLCTLEDLREPPPPSRFDSERIRESMQEDGDTGDRDRLMLGVRLGLLYVKGLREESGRAIVRERLLRPFAGIDDLKRRVPELSKEELRKLAQVGALNFIGRQFTAGGLRIAASAAAGSRQQAVGSSHRRDALWRVERAVRPAGPLLEGQVEQDSTSPLEQMTVEERVAADFSGTGVTVGPHPMAYRREEMRAMGVSRAIDLREIRNGQWVKVAGWVIARQRPGTAKGFLFLSMEDETGIANVIVTPDVFDKNRMVLVSHPFLLVEGPLQNQDNVIHVRARRIRNLAFKGTMPRSHNFH
jgi:error-prone DNA polymerase